MNQPASGIVIVGAGISGLAAALVLAEAGVTVTVVDPERPGGKLRTELFLGRPVDCGADAFLARVPEGRELATELGLGSELVAPSAGTALVWARGRLSPLPGGLVGGVPAWLPDLVRSPLLGPLDRVRACADLVLPRRPGRQDQDRSIADVIARRLGPAVADRIVDPLLGGIHAGDTHRLSVQASAPLLDAARRRRSLLSGLRQLRPPAGAGPTFLAPRRGMASLVDALVERVLAAGAVILPVAAGEIRPAGAIPAGAMPAGQRADRPPAAGHGAPGAGLVVQTTDGPLGAAGVVLAVPGARAAGLVGSVSPAAAAALGAIPTASVALVTLAYRATDLALAGRHPAWSGLLVPAGEGRLMTACSIGSSKWPHWAEPGTVVLRVSAGRAGDDRAARLDEATLCARLHAELVEALGVSGLPLAHRVTRWPDAFPQYEVGHLGRVAAAEAALAADLPGLVLAGASYRGIGIPACIASGRRAAAALLTAVPPGAGGGRAAAP